MLVAVREHLDLSYNRRHVLSSSGSVSEEGWHERMADITVVLSDSTLSRAGAEGLAVSLRSGFFADFSGWLLASWSVCHGRTGYRCGNSQSCRSLSLLT